MASLPPQGIALHPKKGHFSSTRGGAASAKTMAQPESRPEFLFVPMGPSKSQSKRIRQICNAHVQHNVQRRKSIAKQTLLSYHRRPVEEVVRETRSSGKSPASNNNGPPSPPTETGGDSSATSSPPASATSPFHSEQGPSPSTSPQLEAEFSRPPTLGKLSLRGRTPPPENFDFWTRRRNPYQDDSPDTSPSALELYQPPARPSLPSPRSLLDSPIVDPFNATSFPLPKQFSNLLQHFWQVLVPAFFPKLKNPQGYADWLVSTALNDKAALHSCLFAWTADLEVAKGYSIAEIPGSNPQWLHHRKEGIQGLNEILRDPKKATQASTLLAVGMLMAANMLMGNEAELAAHAEGFQRLLTLRGGWHGFPTHIVKVFLRLRYFSALTTGHLPPSPPALPMRPLLLHNTSSSGVLPQLGSGFATLLSADMISPSFYSVAHNITVVTRSKIFYEAYRHILPSEDLDFFSLQDLDIEYQLMIYPRIAKNEESTTAYPSHEPLRLALLIFYHTCLTEHAPSKAVVRHLTQALRMAFGATGFQFSQHPLVCREAATWALCMGAHISKNSSADYNFFIKYLVGGAQVMQLRYFEEVRSIAQRHLYLEKPLRMSLEDIWGDVVLAARDLFP